MSQSPKPSPSPTRTQQTQPSESPTQNPPQSEQKSPTQNPPKSQINQPIPNPLSSLPSQQKIHSPNSNSHSPITQQTQPSVPVHPTVDLDKPRLVLTQIELENFKSYYGRRTIGPFHKRFSSIVGPNGSGKSNVIDALLFVFGRRAKQIRLKRISELVHSSTNHRNCKQARVNVYFQEINDDIDDENTFTVVPNSQLVISRCATKSNKSQYLINNKAVKFSRVKEVLFQKGIDLNNNRFLILQGEVESIAMMKPKSSNNSDDGLLEYLEDIIGSNKYIEQINKCSEQCETLSVEVQERLNRVKIVERDRDKLSEGRDEAIEYIKNQLQLYKLQGISKQVFMNKYGNKLEALNGHLVELNNEIESNEEKQKEIQREMQEIEVKYQQIRKEKNKVEKQVKKEEKQFQEFDQQDVSFSERLKYLKKEMNKIKRNRSKLEKEKVEFTEKIAKNEELIPQLSEELGELQTELESEQEKQERMMNDLTERIQPIKEAMEEKQKALIPLKDRENGIKQELDIISNTIESINHKVSDAQTRKQNILDRIRDIDTNINNQNHSLHNEIETGINTHKSNKTQFENNINQLRTEEKQLQSNIRKCRQEYDNMRVSFQTSKRSKHRIVRCLLQAQEKGDLTGIMGRLGDLGSVDQQFDVAASTAGRHALDHIVVEKTHHAQRAVEYLKTHRLGRATMLILEKQKKFQRKANKRIETPHGVHRLYDLVTFKEDRFRTAFYFAFRDCLVGKDLNQANQLAFSGGKRWRVVTLDGKLIETSGAMSGGGNRPSSGLMSDRRAMQESDVNGRVSETDLRNKEQTLNAMEGRVTELRKELRSLKGQLKQCSKASDKLVVKKRKLRMEINGLQQRKQALTEQIPEIELMTEMSESDSRKLEELGESKMESENEFKSAQHNCELLEDEIRDLEDKILENGGNSLREQKSKIDKLKRQSRAKSKLVTKLKVEMKSMSKKLKASSQKFAKFEKNMSETKAEYDEIKIKKKELEEKAVQLMEVLDSKKELLKEKDIEYQKLSKIVQKNNAIMTKLTKEILLQSEQRKGIESELKQTKHKNKKCKSEWQSLCNKYHKNKSEFLGDFDEESDTEMNDKKESEKKVSENSDKNAMEIDTDTDTNMQSDTGHESEEKAMVIDEEETPKAKANGISLVEYTNDNCLKFEMLSDTQLSAVDPSEIDAEIEEIKSILKESKVNMGAIEAYRVKDNEYIKRLKDLQNCKKNRDAIRGEYENLKKKRFDSFMLGFSAICRKLKEMYRTLTFGGDAELELVDSIDPFSEGVQFSVRPPKKSWKNISNLSGGEKTLSSMALVFALHHYKPTPLYVMDEIDAALDFKNVSIVANYIHQRTKNAQFVIISLRNNMFELANRLVGIYKTDNASKSITIDPKLFNLPTEQTQMQTQTQNRRNSGGMLTKNIHINDNHNHNHNTNHNRNSAMNESEDDDIFTQNSSANIKINIESASNNENVDMIEID